MKSASKNTGLFSWGGYIPGVGKVVDYADDYLDKKAKQQKVGAFAEKEFQLADPSKEVNLGGNNEKLLLLGLIAWISGIF